MKIKYKKNNKVPQFRFPEFSDEWKEFELNEIDVFISDGNYGEQYPKSHEMQRSGIPFIRANNIHNLKVVWDDMYFINEDLHRVLLSGHLKTGDILVTTRGDIGGLAYVTNEFNGSNINAQLCLLRSGKNLSPFYLLNYLASEIGKRQFKALETGSALKQLPKKNLGKIRIFLPTLIEQRKIADFLSAVDEWVENLEKQKTALEIYKKGLMQKIFSQEIRFKNDNGENFPEWKKYKFSDLYTFGNSNSLSRSNIGYKEGSVFNIHYGDIHTKFKTHFNLQKEIVPYIKPNYENTITNKGFLNEGDVVIADASEDYEDIGKTIEIISTAGENIVSGLHTIVGKRIDEKICNGFAAYLFSSERVKIGIKKMAQGVKVLGLPKKYLKDLVFSLPSATEQKKIINFFNPIDLILEKKTRQINQIKMWKKGLIQRMFI